MIQEKRRVLGRGLESLIPAARTVVPAAAVVTPVMAEAAPGERVQEIRLEEIEPSPYQPRRRQDEAALEELAQSIRAQGVLQPIVVRYIFAEGRGLTADGGHGGANPENPHPISPTPGGIRVGQPGHGGANPENPHPISPTPGEIRVGQPAGEIRVGQPAGEIRVGQPGAPATIEHQGERAPAQIKYQLIAGERRWLASKRAGRETVPAIVREVSNEQAMEMALIENLQREDLDCMEMAYAFERLGREFGLTQEEMSKRTGKDRGTISNLLRLLKLPAELRTALGRHELSFGHAKELMSIEDATVMTAAAQKVVRESLSVRATGELVNRLIWLGPVKEDKKQKPERAVDPNVRAAEQELERALGCRVKINDNRGKGKIIIQYSTLEDFDRVVEALGK